MVSPNCYDELWKYSNVLYAKVPKTRTLDVAINAFPKRCNRSRGSAAQQLRMSIKIRMRNKIRRERNLRDETLLIERQVISTATLWLCFDAIIVFYTVS